MQLLVKALSQGVMALYQKYLKPHVRKLFDDPKTAEDESAFVDDLAKVGSEALIAYAVAEARKEAEKRGVPFSKEQAIDLALKQADKFKVPGLSRDDARKLVDKALGR